LTKPDWACQYLILSAGMDKGIYREDVYLG